MSDPSVPPSEPELEPGLTLLEISTLHRSFVSGEQEPGRLHCRYFLRERDQAFIGKVWFGPRAEGPPGHAHGGSMAAVLDECMGLSSWIAGHQVVAARVAFEFKAALPLGRWTTVEAWVEKKEGRRVFTRGRLSSNGVVHSESEGIFVELSSERINRLSDGARKEG